MHYAKVSKVSPLAPDWEEAGLKDWQQIQIILKWLFLPQSIFTLYWYGTSEGHSFIICNILSELDLRCNLVSPPILGALHLLSIKTKIYSQWKIKKIIYQRIPQFKGGQMEPVSCWGERADSAEIQWSPLNDLRGQRGCTASLTQQRQITAELNWGFQWI